MNVLSEFIDIERHKYEGEDNNLFTFSLGQASGYYEFILIIAERHSKASQRLVSNYKKLMESLPQGDGVGVMTDEQMRLLEQGQQLTTLVHLEIESFYLFAKILLDKIALFLYGYFGQAYGISLASHDKLTKSYEQYRTAKGLVYPDGFAESLEFLKEYICDYRDKQISHLQNPRAIKGTIYDLHDQTRIAATQLYPTPDELHAQVESKELSDLINAIDKYIQQVIAVIELNRVKTRFSLKEQSSLS
jgi:hypothetical protein